MAVDADFSSSDQFTSNANPGDRWQAQIEAHKAKNEYMQAAEVLAAAIEAEPQVKHYYWQLGLMQLLAGAEEDAQVTWMFAITSDDSESTASDTQELVRVLSQEAQRQEHKQEWLQAILVRQYIHQIDPTDLTNLLALIRLNIKQNALEQELLTTTTEQLVAQSPSQQGNPPLLPEHIGNQILHTLKALLNYVTPDRPILDFISSCLPYLKLNVTDRQTGLLLLLQASDKVGFSLKQFAIAITLIEFCLDLAPDNLIAWSYLAQFHQNIGQFEPGLAAARTQYEKSQTLVDRLSASHMLLRGLLGAGGHWQEALRTFQNHLKMTAELVAAQPQDLERIDVTRLMTTSFFTPYIKDEPAQTRPLQNQLMALCTANIHRYAQAAVQKYATGFKARAVNDTYRRSDRRLKIGYLSSGFWQHSVGWLARWLIKNHDRDRFDLHGYFLDYRQGQDPLQEWYVKQMDHCYLQGVDGEGDTLTISNRIFADEIDILIDLDSITLDTTCEIMAMKPAPLQATWLGLDGSGLPTIDYFIADHYSLPAEADQYYQEKIWRLPHSFIAVDGFEAAVPTIHRQDFGIPAEAVVYLTAQVGLKRHPDTLQRQLEIIKAVPNSYLAIKGLADNASMTKLCQEMAAAMEISYDRLVFLPLSATEAEHRANLTIADVVLDTYPYNGATTTLETLWMGIPIVTRVGKQFSARNAYSLMVNAGISAGIAWSDREYVEWGIRLGSDLALRQQVCWQLRQSRHSQPLWDSKQFTRDMEAAYINMWQQKWQGDETN
ncbi:hypothetical protein Pse7367_0829 [Thalassoporum mexicanum PCC 7367]|uniref:O-linked N-acetylglucosamine transferase, SPINDLY family protein n=1 Tax=Thalassoporum mexicanum TaxID=3457544 RepID=UPI00029F8898|nr:hypothetical protein [Pseudanabaena sp. PCC 7367]AFY69129.1 hypothetical protein Pse7367_0829 [Pseudanabaena sp. PCC 7367]